MVFFHLETGSVSVLMAGEFRQPPQWPLGSISLNSRTTREICNERRFQIKLVFFSLPKQARLPLSSSLEANHSLLEHVPCSGLSLPILQGHLPSGPALLSDLLGSTVPPGSTEAFSRSHLKETFAGALDSGRRTGELPFLKKAAKGGTASYTVPSLSSQTL